MAQALVAHGAAASGGDGFGRWLRDTTALVLPGAPKNPFQAYSGLVSDAISRAEPRAAPPRPVVRPAPAQRTGLTAGIGWVREAYHRLERLITGQIRPASPQEARKVFAEAEITVVRRTTPTGSTTTYQATARPRRASAPG